MQTIIIYSAIYTAICILVIPCIGLLINFITEILLNSIASIFGGKTANFVANRVTFIGTVHHELSHALFAFLTGAKVTKIELFRPVGDRLGQVGFITRGNNVLKSIQLTMSSIAPVICGTITEYILIYKLDISNYHIAIKIIYLYIIISILFHMTMSTQDIKNALRGLPICTFIIFSIIFIILLAHGGI